MTDAVRLFNIQPSPNNMKARIALSYKGIPYEKVDVNPQDRSEVLRISTQPLTPTLQHGDTVIFDSGAILRYLEAQFPDTPRLFAREYDAMKEIERWEWLGRTLIPEPIGMIFGLYIANKTDANASARASALLHERTAAMEERLEEHTFLVGDAMTAADVTIAPFVFYGMVPEEIAAASPTGKYFRDHLRLGEGRGRTREWVGRIMAYDRAPAAAAG